MKSFLLAIMLLFATSCTASDMEHKAMYALSVAGGEGTCTAYAVGPHAIETSEHCLAGPPYKLGDREITVKGDPILDHKEHAILILNDADFKDFIVLNFKEPKVGDKVHTYTNPVGYSGLMDQYDEGYRSGSDGDQIVFFLPISPGSSGSVIFNEDGSVAGIVSQGAGPYCFSYKLGFTAGDLVKAAAK